MSSLELGGLASLLFLLSLVLLLPDRIKTLQDDCEYQSQLLVFSYVTSLKGSSCAHCTDEKTEAQGVRAEILSHVV